MNLRLSATWVERFRLYRSADFITPEDMDSTIRGEFQPTRQVALGSALDAVLERPHDRQARGVAMGMGFTEADIAACLGAVDLSGMPQVKLTRDYHVGPDRVTVVAKFDRINGTRVDEYKTRWSTFDIDGYLQSAQTSLYLDISGADEMRYHVFCFTETERGGIELRDTHTFSAYPYPSLHADCLELVAGLTEYVHTRGLEPYCQERKAA